MNSKLLTSHPLPCAIARTQRGKRALARTRFEFLLVPRRSPGEEKKKKEKNEKVQRSRASTNSPLLPRVAIYKLFLSLSSFLLLREPRAYIYVPVSLFVDNTEGRREGGRKREQRVLVSSNAGGSCVGKLWNMSAY